MLLEPGYNVWRIARAGRASMLIDAANYFAAVRSAMIKAERSILIAGWDIHSQTRLVGTDGRADDGYPETFAEFLAALVAKKPRLEIRLLLWDFSVLYATERDPFPTATLQWNTPHNIRFCLDDCVPIGSSQHQKLVAIDDKVAFSGGLDLTVRRWDTCAHRPDDPLRVDPAGKPYGPFHDVQMVVDGDAARALSELLRSRWACAALEDVAAVKVDGDPWPDGVRPDFTETDVGIARTEPRFDGRPEAREVEKLFFDMIDVAERSIYIENQFLTTLPFAQCLADRLRAKPELEALIVSPQTHVSWLEAQSMRAGRARFAEVLSEFPEERVALLYPRVETKGAAANIMVHSKVMAVDDRIIRIGSANLNNRSMGTDTECDLVVVAQTEGQRETVARLRNTLIGDHCGATAEEVAHAIAQNGGSLVKTGRALARNGHSLQPIVDDPKVSEAFGLIQGVADPEKPIGAEEFISNMFGGYVPARHYSTVLKVVAAGLVIVGLAMAWQFVPLADPKSVKEAFSDIAGSHWAPFVVIGSFVIAGSLMFPVTVLIAATAAAFGPWTGFTYAFIGALASALTTYAIGAAIGKRTVQDLLGPRLNRIRQKIAARGVVSIAAIRLVPVAPFTVVNLAAGASAIPVFDYMAGTVIGMLPGMIMISAVGNQFARILTSPTPFDIAALVVAVGAWVALSIGVQAAVSRYWSAGR
ncbi:VTT domain-containing protein [Pseudolabrys sp. FHR47]|uniref:VTT domain-containing protein n=1 Tax=Pseudolabrys sp. FHR47 TaxID=2562284 RepID=UPI0010BE69CE|nr:VTT domain-containing protein [Pseudolabrys sp. FHR47]